MALRNDGSLPPPCCPRSSVLPSALILLRGTEGRSVSTLDLTKSFGWTGHASCSRRTLARFMHAALPCDRISRHVAVVPSMRQRQLVGEAGGLCSADAFEQQDVQELFTLLVDVLSTVLKGACCTQPYVCAGRVCCRRCEQGNISAFCRAELLG
jgi:hypothetical protein